MASSSSLKTPPLWEDGKSFENWKSEMELWALITELDKKKREPVVALRKKTRDCT